LVLLGFTHNIPLIIGCYLLRGTLMNLGQPALQSFVMGILPPRERGAASSIFNVGFQVTSAAGGVLSGYLLTQGNYALIFSLAGLCYLGAMLMLVPWFGREATLLHREAPTILPEQELSPYGE
jgi:MFS family permease